jgi:hypothetical protein
MASDKWNTLAAFHLRSLQQRKKAQSHHWRKGSFPNLAHVGSDWVVMFSDDWNCLMKMAIGFFGIQEGPFVGILAIKYL